MSVNKIILATAIAGLFTASASAQELIVKIGHVAPTTGSIAHLGKDNENGFKMAIDDLNAKGVTIGGKKVPFVSKLSITDAKFKDNKSVITYQEPKVEDHPTSLFNVNRMSR